MDGTLNSVRDVGQRCLTFMTYLNDDFEGGETEFLYQKRSETSKRQDNTCLQDLTTLIEED